MGRPRKIRPEVETSMPLAGSGDAQEIVENSSQSTAPQPRIASTEPPDTKVRRISFPVSDNGKVEWAGMRLTTKDEVIKILRTIVTDKNEMSALGLGEQTAPVAEIFSEDWTGSIYDALGSVESYFAQRHYGLPREMATRVFTYSEAEKSKLAGPTAKVLNKYAMRYDWLVAFKEEIALGILLIAITTVKFKMAGVLSDQYKAGQRKQIAVPQPVVTDEANPVPVQ